MADRKFTIDAIAREAGVARMTVYYQFGSKTGLLEALFDNLAERGLMPALPHAIARSDPIEALGELVDAFTTFWGSDRIIIRRVRALGALDPEIEQALRERDARRRQHLKNIAEPLGGGKRGTSLTHGDDAIDVLQALTSFEMFDWLARGGRRPEDVARLVLQLAIDTLGLKSEAPRAKARSRRRTKSH